MRFFLTKTYLRFQIWLLIEFPYKYKFYDSWFTKSPTTYTVLILLWNRKIAMRFDDYAF